EMSESFAKHPWSPRVSVKEESKVRPTNGAFKGYLPISVWHDRGQAKARDFQSRMLGANGEEIYSVHMTIDDKGRRVTPNPRVLRSRILMFGDSYVLGEGVEDREVASWVLGEKRPETKVYNLGVAGGSPNDCLYELQTDQAGRLEDIGPSGQTIVVYTFIDHHMERLFARSSAVRPDHDWILEKPYYGDRGGKIVFKGGVKEDRAFLNAFYRLFHSSAIVDFFDLVLPPFFTSSDYAFFGKIMKAMKESSLTRFGPRTAFFMVIFPEGPAPHAAAVKNAALKEGIQVMDYQRIDVPLVTEGRGAIPGDGHPSPLTQALFAHLLDRDLPRF
ncbi:MAG TPA: hypothetical protein PL182_09795, partial [Pseudobdellovibrionaceae bacterium]|nr:hypothetical protein [Pseudobdellovibrionaceae bacterium]